MSTDGSMLATGHADSSILIWDVAAQSKRKRVRKPSSPQELEQKWAELAGSDARKAHAAIWALAAAPAEAFPFLGGRLEPVAAIPAERLRQLLADLDSPRFKEREAAFQALGDVGEQVEPALTDALRTSPSAEARNRIEALLARPRRIQNPEELRSLRALEALDQMAIPETAKIFERLAQGAPHARLTREAKASLARRAVELANRER
jgi:hypothetical protein